MRERPILFSGEMVRAILRGTKTQTRRVVKPGPSENHEGLHFPWASFFHSGTVATWDRNGVGGQNWNATEHPSENRYEQALARTPYENACPYGQPGDRLRLLSSWATDKRYDGLKPTDLPGDSELGRPVFWTRWDGTEKPAWCGKLRPGRFLPSSLRWMMPIAEITGVRVERLQDISEEDARTEGVTAAPFCKAGRPVGQEHVEAFEDLWRSINGAESWDANPWVWVVGFKRIETEAAR